MESIFTFTAEKKRSVKNLEQAYREMGSRFRERNSKNPRPKDVALIGPQRGLGGILHHPQLYGVLECWSNGKNNYSALMQKQFSDRL